jgi:hypothetical protein
MLFSYFAIWPILRPLGWGHYSWMAGHLRNYIVAVGYFEKVGYCNLAFGFGMGQRGGFVQEFVLQPIFFGLWHYV